LTVSKMFSNTGGMLACVGGGVALEGKISEAGGQVELVTHAGCRSRSVAALFNSATKVA